MSNLPMSKCCLCSNTADADELMCSPCADQNLAEMAAHLPLSAKGHPAYEAFLRGLRGCIYGYEPTNQAWAWFKEGWVAREGAAMTWNFREDGPETFGGSKVRHADWCSDPFDDSHTRCKRPGKTTIDALYEEAERTGMEARLRASDRRADEMGIARLDRSRIVEGCTFEEYCSPYISEAWGHDRRCPRSSYRTPAVPIRAGGCSLCGITEACRCQED